MTVTQRRIVDAAIELFAERGFEGATTLQIAARAAVAEKTLFANFGSKERLYQAALEPATLLATMLPEALRTLVPVLEGPHDDLRELLTTLLENRVRFARAHRREVRLLAQHLLLRPEAFGVLLAAFEQRIAPILMPLVERLVARGAARSDVPARTVVRIAITSAIGYLLTTNLLRPDDPWDDAVEIRHIVAVLADGIAPRPASASFVAPTAVATKRGAPASRRRASPAVKPSGRDRDP
jgi:AcrR family transcriptional regulator